MDDLMAMRGFVRVVEAGNFSRAAALLNMPKSTLTKSVQRMEAELKVKLLNRTTRRVVVTADGAAYYERLVRLLDEFDDLHAAVATAQTSPSGLLRVEMGGATAQFIVLPALKQFQEHYPDIRLELKISDRQADLVAENIDCVVRAGNLRDPSLIARHLGDMSIITCASPDYLSANGTPARPEDIERQHTVVSYMNAQTGEIFPFDFEKTGEKCLIRGQHKLAVAEGTTYLAASLAGLGIIQVPAFMAREDIAAGRLVQLLSDWQSVKRPYYIVYPPNRHVSVRLRAFMDWLAKLFASADL
jgi:DNA-binding transcriptional LysR family regulator